jgi:hypothetical protein
MIRALRSHLEDLGLGHVLERLVGIVVVVVLAVVLPAVLVIPRGLSSSDG